MELWRKNLAFLNDTTKSSAQAGAATAAGIQQPAYSRILSGQTQAPGFETIAGLARHYGVSLDDLVNRDLERDGPSKPSQPERLDPERMATAAGTIDSFLLRTGHRPSALQRASALCDLYVALGQSHPTPADFNAATAVILESLGKR